MALRYFRSCLPDFCVVILIHHPHGAAQARVMARRKRSARHGAAPRPLLPPRPPPPPPTPQWARAELHVDAAIDSAKEDGTLSPRPRLCNYFLFCCSHCASLSRCACAFCKPVVFERRNCRVPRCRLARVRPLPCTSERVKTPQIGRRLDACCVRCGPGRLRVAAAMARSMGATGAQLAHRTPRQNNCTAHI
jgi:hypothetical protein